MKYKIATITPKTKIFIQLTSMFEKN